MILPVVGESTTEGIAGVGCMLLNEIRFAVRVMRRSPVFSATVILTVTLAIIAVTTIFSVVNSVLLKPLPFKDPNTLVQVAEKNDNCRSSARQS
jgi:hypothetical protein